MALILARSLISKPNLSRLISNPWLREKIIQWVKTKWLLLQLLNIMLQLRSLVVVLWMDSIRKVNKKIKLEKSMLKIKHKWFLSLVVVVNRMTHYQNRWVHIIMIKSLIMAKWWCQAISETLLYTICLVFHSNTITDKPMVSHSSKM